MIVCCLDMEGVLTPEIWIRVAERTGVPELRLTTRDIPDYDALMRRRLAILRRHGIRLRDIQSVIARMEPLPGARRFLDRLRTERQVVILSDTYYEFAMPLVRKLGLPTLLCNWLSTDRKGFISRYHLRQKNGKQNAVRAFKRIGFRVHAAGDSFNDILMLKAADRAVFFSPPPAIARQFPEIRVTRNYAALAKALL